MHVDGAQTWGALRINLRELGCDSYSASAQSGFSGRAKSESSMFERNRIAEIWPNTVAPGWGVDADAGCRRRAQVRVARPARRCAPRRYPHSGRVSDMIGPEKIEARVVELAGRLKSRVKDFGLPLVTPIDPAISGGVVVVRATPEKGKQAYETLDRNGASRARQPADSGCVHTSTTPWRISIGRLRAFNQFAICSLR